MSGQCLIEIKKRFRIRAEASMCLVFVPQETTLIRSIESTMHKPQNIAYAAGIIDNKFTQTSCVVEMLNNFLHCCSRSLLCLRIISDPP
jgi:hypothetical protein